MQSLSKATTTVIINSVVLVGSMLIAVSSLICSPNLDEVGHLPAGCLVIDRGNFELYEVNPPLVKALAACPVLLSKPQYDWALYSTEPGRRMEWAVGRAFIEANGKQSFWYFAIARWALLPIWLLGTLVIGRWASELGGPLAALGATVAWCFCPEVMGWTATICPDSAAASMGVTCLWCVRSWLRERDSLTAILVGVSMGLALLTKTTWLILVPVVPLLAIAQNQLPWRRKIRHVLLIAVIALYVLNSGYGFSRSFTQLADFQFFSASLAGRQPDGSLRHRVPQDAGNRFADSWLGQIPVPLPGSFVEGLDLQKYDFEEGKWSYLRGEHKFGGWWYWYIYALLVKTPVGLLLLVSVAAVLTLRGWKRGKNYIQLADGELPAAASQAAAGETNDVSNRAGNRLTYRQELLILLLPAVAVFVLVSSQTGFSRYLRYVLPCYPFAFIWMSQVFSPVINPWPWLRRTCWGLLAWSVISSLSVFPHSMSYFNELAGGPKNGPAHLIDASIDWGQDVLFLADWCEQHPEAKPLYLSLHVFFDPRVAGIEYEHPPVDHRYASQRQWVTSDKTGPLPGWYAISVHQLYSRNREFAYLFDFDKTDMVGYSIYIYEITIEQANDWRRKHDLPPVDGDDAAHD